MARKPVNYWEKRSTELMKSIEKNTEYTINDLIKIYNNATININKEIETIFKNFGKHGVLEKDVLKQLLNKSETEIHYKNLLKVINENIKDESLKKKLLTKYNAPAYAYRISRLQELQDNINIEMYKLAKLEQNITESRYIKTIDEAYHHTIYDIQKGTRYGFSFSQLNSNTLKLMLANKWIDNKNYSQRIWNNIEKLGEYLRTNLSADIITGKSVQKISKSLSEYMNVGTYNATRLVRTEVNHFANETEALAYEECEIEKYQFIATLDNRTCDKCASLDNRVFNVKDRKTGVNYPPMHANDRCTTVAYFDDEVTEGLERRARDENGKTIKVPSSMNYNEWKEKYVTNSSKNDIIYPYIRKNVAIGYDTDNEEKAIKDAINLLPQNLGRILDEKLEFEIVTKGTSDFDYSRYDSKNKKIYIYQKADKYEVIHEIGHFIEDIALKNNNEYLKLKQELIDNSKLTIIKRDNRLVYALKNDNFVDEYQGYIHSNDRTKFKNKYGMIKQEYATEIFSESFREYFENRENLKQRLPKFYKMIEELLK